MSHIYGLSLECEGQKCSAKQHCTMQPYSIQ